MQVQIIYASAGRGKSAWSVRIALRGGVVIQLPAKDQQHAQRMAWAVENKPLGELT